MLGVPFLTTPTRNNRRLSVVQDGKGHLVPTVDLATPYLDLGVFPYIKRPVLAHPTGQRAGADQHIAHLKGLLLKRLEVSEAKLTLNKSGVKKDFA